MNYEKELSFAKSLALKAGEVMVSGFSKSTITVKSNLTPVTETDVAISTLVISEVQKYFPAHTVMDEEVQSGVTEAENVWVCDPIDGTVPFSYHIPTSMFSLVLCKRGEPVVAVIYDPYMKRLLYTSAGSPSYANDKQIGVKQGGFESGDFIYGIPDAMHGFDMNQYVQAMFAKKVNVSFVESIVYQAMLVALGLARGMVMPAANPWDRAAAKFIVENAGGRCTDERGEKLPVFGNPKIFIATNGTVHDEVLDIVRRCLV